MFSYGSFRSMSSATVTPSLVTFGLPQPLSRTALRPRGPSVERTARASFETPASSFWRASSANDNCFAATSQSPDETVESSGGGPARHVPPVDMQHNHLL